jgi:hypothetical protein
MSDRTGDEESTETAVAMGEDHIGALPDLLLSYLMSSLLAEKHFISRKTFYISLTSLPRRRGSHLVWHTYTDVDLPIFHRTVCIEPTNATA